MKRIDKNYAIRMDCFGYQLLKIEKYSGGIQYVPVATFLNLQSLIEYYVDLRLSATMAEQCFLTTKKTLRDAVENIRRIRHDLRDVVFSPQPLPKVA